MLTRNTKQVTKVLLLLLGLNFIIASCGNGVTDGKGYIAYVEDSRHGLKKSVESGKLIYDIQYKTAEYIMLNEEFSGHENKGIPKKKMEKLKKMVWLNLTLRLTEGNISPLRSELSGYEDYAARLAYFETVAKRNMDLEYGSGGPKIAPTVYFFENNYGAAPFERIVLGFEIPDEQPKKDITFSYTDELFRTGIIKASFSASDIEHIPVLKQ